MSPQSEPQVLFTRQEIAETVKRLAGEIKRDYQGKNPLLIGVLKGCFIFMADLIRLLDFRLTVEFVTLSSYGRGTESSGKVKLVRCLSAPVKGCDVLVVEDIVDTGLSLKYIEELFSEKSPNSMKVVSLLVKPGSLKYDVKIDYIGFRIPDKFVIGYGLDFAQKYRNLRGIYVLNT